MTSRTTSASGAFNPAHGMARPGSVAGQAPIPRRHLASKAPIYSVPFLLVLGYLLVDYGRPHNWFPVLGLIRPGVIVLGGGILSLVFNRAFTVPPLGKYMLAFLGLMALLVPFSYNPRMAFNLTRDFSLFMFGAVLPLMAFVDTYERLQKMLRFWVWIHVPLALYSITHRGVGIGSFLVDENDFALAMNMALPYAIALVFLERNTLRRLLMMGAALVLVVATTATMSRGGFIGLVCVAIFAWIRSPRKILSLSLVVMLASTMLIVTPSSYWKEMETISSASEEGDTGAVRLYLWGIAWEMFKDHPVLGVGPGNYQYNNVLYEDPAEKAQGRHVWGQVSHSLYFTVLPEFGIVGTTLFLAMLIAGIRARRGLSRACRDRLLHPFATEQDRERTSAMLQWAAAMDAVLATFLVTGAFISVLYYPHIWLLTAFTAVMVRIGPPPLVDTQLAASAPVGPALAPARPAHWPQL